MALLSRFSLLLLLTATYNSYSILQNAKETKSMKSVHTKLSEIKLVGITARTNNAQEMNPATAQIGATIQRYFQNNFSAKTLHRIPSNKTFCVYTNYESDFNGDYTYFIGQEVESFEDIPEGCTALTIPAQQYEKFTSEQGAMPTIVINVWQHIWNMKPEELDKNRTYIADFEIYDERSFDPQKSIVDVYIGVKK